MSARGQKNESALRRRTPVTSPSVMPKPTRLRPWQSAALEAWLSNGSRGIVAAATGTGKTTLALAAIAEFWDSTARVAIVVPTIALQRQWVKALADGFGLVRTQIGTMGGDSTDIREGHGFIVSVINSARAGLPALTEGWRSEGRRVLLIVDECHWAAADANSDVFRSPFDATLGLSATPERTDDGFDEVLVPQLGDVVFRYSLREALDDDLLAPLTCWNLLFDLTAKENADLAPIQARIERIERSLLEEFPDVANALGLARIDALLRRSDGVRGAASLRDLYAQRSALLEASGGRRSALEQIAHFAPLRTKPSLVFHERIEEARNTAQMFERAGVRTAIELSTDPPARRAEALRDLRSGAAQVLIAVKTLDEGIDLPDAKIAVIAAGSTSTRQRLQRIGRVVRPTGEPALAISLIARGTNEEFVIAANDGSLVGSSRVQLIASLDDGIWDGTEL